MINLHEKTKICFAIAHNKNEVRNNYLFKQLKICQDNLINIEIRIIDSFQQPKVKNYNSLHSLIRDMLIWKTSREWTRYRLYPPQPLLSSIKKFLKDSIKIYISEHNSNQTNGHKRDACIYQFINDKHISLWKKFLQTDSDFIIIFEDDVIFKNDSIEKLNILINQISKNNYQQPLYIDLAGGCFIEALQIDRLLESKSDTLLYYKKPTTNTACALLMNREMAFRMYNYTSKRPWLKMLPIDWLLNKNFIALDKKGIVSACIHTYPTLFKHGSVTGEYSSFNNENQPSYLNTKNI